MTKDCDGSVSESSTTANSQRAAEILLNPGAMDQGILTVGRFDSGYRAGIVAYQQLKTVPFKNLSKPYRRDAYVVNQIYGVVDDCKPCMHLLLWCIWWRRRTMSADDLDVWINYLLEGKQ